MALAGIILAVVLIGGSQAKKVQRDHDRKNVIDRSVEALNNIDSLSNFPAPNSIVIPAFYPGCNCDTWIIASLNIYGPHSLPKPTIINSAPPVSPAPNTIYWVANTAPTVACGGKFVAGYIAYTLEVGSNAVYCQAY